MGVIATLKKAFRPRLADLLRQDRALLETAIAGAAYRLLDDDMEACRVVTDHFTVTFVWMWRERWIDADIEANDIDHPLDPYAKHSARSWLEAQGLRAPPRQSGPMGPLLLRDELECVREVVARIFFDEQVLRQALFFLAGQMEGYNDVAVVPEDMPPANVIRWAESRFRRLPKWESRDKNVPE